MNDNKTTSMISGTTCLPCEDISGIIAANVIEGNSKVKYTDLMKVDIEN